MPTTIAGTSQAAKKRLGWTNQVKGAHGGTDGRLVARREMTRRRVNFSTTTGEEEDISEEALQRLTNAGENVNLGASHTGHETDRTGREAEEIAGLRAACSNRETERTGREAEEIADYWAARVEGC